MTLQDASRITGREIKVHTTAHGPWEDITWKTATHDMQIVMGRCLDTDLPEVMVFGEPHSAFCGRRRPHRIWVINPSEKYLKKLAIV